MNIILTGGPRSGKTTLLQDFVETASYKQGFVAREVVADGDRVGFELVSSYGRTVRFADINSVSTVRVARYGVNVDRLDGFLDDMPPIEAGSLLYIDEIGQMQLYSDKFRELVSRYLRSENQYVGTITNMYRDDFIEAVLARDDVVLLKIDQDSRDAIRGVLDGLAANITLLPKLSPAMHKELIEMARGYVEASKYIQLKKLFKNAISYIAEERVDRAGGGMYVVRGNTREHTVSHKAGRWVCDCDLFNGAGNFVGEAGECSHVQTVKLFLVKASRE